MHLDEKHKHGPAPSLRLSPTTARRYKAVALPLTSAQPDARSLRFHRPQRSSLEIGMYRSCTECHPASFACTVHGLGGTVRPTQLCRCEPLNRAQFSIVLLITSASSTFLLVERLAYLRSSPARVYKRVHWPAFISAKLRISRYDVGRQRPNRIQTKQYLSFRVSLKSATHYNPRSPNTF
jgi:hypothetical protein